MERNISVYSLAYLELNGNPLFRNNITNICNEVVLRVNTYLFLKCDYSQYDLPTSELDGLSKEKRIKKIKEMIAKLDFNKKMEFYKNLVKKL